MAGIQLNAQRIRFACDASKPFAQVTDAISGQALALPSGSALQIETLFYFGSLLDADLLDLSVYSSITLALQDNADPHSGTIFYTGAIALANFQASTAAQWTAGTNQHLLLNISSAQNIVPPAVTNYWIVIYGTLVSTGDYVLLFAANITGKDSGVPVAGASLPQNLKLGGKLPFVCSPANGGDGLTRDLILGPGPGGIWITQIDQVGYNGAGQAKYAFLCDVAHGGDGLFRDVQLQLQDGQYVLAIDQNGHS